MSNVLSQAEIDELLNALSSGGDAESKSEEADHGSARSYDFKTANKFPKEQIRTLNIVFQTFAQLLATQFSGMLRTTCECELLSVEELSFNEFNNSLPTPVILALLNIAPMTGSQIMEISPEAAYIIINRLLGGLKASLENSVQFTEIELALIERVLRQTMRLFADSWEKVMQVDAQIERIETSSQFTQIVALNEPTAIITINLVVGDESGLISIGIPHSSIEPIAKMLNTRLWYSSTNESKRIQMQPDVISERLVRTKVNMTAYFEETPATVIDILNLQVGDVIRLSQRTEQPIMVKIQHIPKFLAKIGTSGNKYAVQVVDILKGAEQDESITG